MQLDKSFATLETREDGLGRRFSIDFDYLLLIAFLTDLLTPFLIWKGIVPAEVRWLSNVVLVVIIILAYARMMTYDRIPGAVWVIVGISVISGSVAIINDQGIVETLWGWIRLFEFPLIGLYVYLSPRWQNDLVRKLIYFTVVILTFEVGVQVAQYLTGEPIGDHLAGTFGRFGIGKLMLLTSFVVCFSLGKFLAYRNWKTLVLVGCLAVTVSILGAIRIMPVILFLLALISFFLFIYFRQTLSQFMLVLGMFVGVIFIFLIAYNYITPVAEIFRVEEYLDFDTLVDYLGRYQVVARDEGEKFQVGRNYAIVFAWNIIKEDPMTLVFGMGIGARGESVSLGTQGIGLTNDPLGTRTRSSLLILIQEMGLFGLLIVVGYVLWISIRLIRQIRENPESKTLDLQYALLIFSMMWPVWLWYKTVLTNRVAMLLYWASIALVMREFISNKHASRKPIEAEHTEILRQG
jgi:hypothetical protein